MPESSVYSSWCEKSREFVNPERHVILQTIGRAPVEAPPHPARLTPVRRMRASSPGPGGGAAGDSSSSAEPGSDDAAPPSREGGGGPRRPRSFSAQCSKVLGKQGPVETFSPQRIYRACDFFNVCSLCFIRELVNAGEPALWQGTTFDSKAVVYSEGDAGTSMFVVVRGTAELLVRGREPRELRPYDYFGEAQALGVLAERQETVRAKTSLHVLEISCSTLTNLLRRERQEDMVLEMAAATRGGTSWDGSSSASSRGRPRGASFEASTPRTSRSSFGGVRTYAFQEERRHFEQLAGQLHQQLVRRPQRHGRLRVGTGTEEEQQQQLGGSEAASPTAAGAAASAAAAPGAAAAGEEASAEPTGRGGARGGGPGAGGRPTAEAQGAGAARRPAASPAAQATPRRSVALASSVPHVTGLENPRLWRQQLEEMQAMLLEGDISDDGFSRDRFVQRLKESIRNDLRRGYMMPADVAKVRKDSRNSSRGDTWLVDSGCVSRTDNAQSRKEERRAALEDEEFLGSDEGRLLDLRLLPPLGFMNARQKHALLQQLQRQAKKSHHKAMVRHHITSVMHLAGLSKMLKQKQQADISSPVSARPTSPRSPLIAEGGGAALPVSLPATPRM